MNENNANRKKTPLRNSNAANRPFRSPLTTISSPNVNQSPKNVSTCSPMQKNATPKRSVNQFRYPMKRRRIEEAAKDDSLTEKTNKVAESNKLLSLKSRIAEKRRQLENLNTKLNYIKKHNHKDLDTQIDKWQTVCKEALLRLQKDIRSRNSSDSDDCNILKIMSTLGITENIVNFVDD